MNTKPSYSDTAEGARQCLVDSTDPQAVTFVLAKVDSGEFTIVPDPEHARVWGLRNADDRKVLAIFWLDSVDVEFSDALLEMVYA